MIQGVRNIMHDSKEKEIIFTLNLIAHYIMKNESQLGNCACIEVHIRTASSLSITYIGNHDNNFLYALVSEQHYSSFQIESTPTRIESLGRMFATSNFVLMVSRF